MKDISMIFEKLKLYILITAVLLVGNICATQSGKHIQVTVTDDFPDSVEIKLEKEIKAGALVRISAGGPHMQMSVGVESVISDNGRALEPIKKFSREEMNSDWRWHMRSQYMIIARATEDIEAGRKLRLELFVQDQGNSTAPLSSGGEKAANCFAGLNWYLQAGVIEDIRSVDFEPVSERAYFDFIAGEPEYIEAYLKPGGKLQIVHFDKYGNPAVSGECVFEIHTGDQTIRHKCKSGYDAAEVVVGEDVQRVRVVDLKGFEAWSNARPVSLDGKPIWFGEFHWHTEFSSDGQRPLEDSLKSARDQVCLDFAGPADHIEVDGNYAYGKISRQKEILASFEDPGKFAVLTGAELSKRYGHCNYYSSEHSDFKEICDLVDQSDKFAADGDDEYPHRSLARACNNNSLYIPHHSNMDSWVSEGVVHPDGRPFWCAINFPANPSDDMLKTLRLFEMCQLRGCFESENTDDQWHVLYGGLGGSAQTALMRGYRIGFVGASDNHCGWPTRASSGKVGITGVISDSLDKDSIYKNLYNRRCYASTGQRIIADAALNGCPTGQVAVLGSGEERLFEIMVKGTSELDKVELISMGLVLKSFEIEDGCRDLHVRWADERPGRPLEDIYYYVRARQKDGSCVWLSPWLIESK